MISIILPYWDRQAAADKALRRLAAVYPDLDLEVVVIDDGNQVPFAVPEVNLNLVVMRLPKKSEPLSPAPCWNDGVKLATGDVVVLSSIEVLHEKPVLEQMAAGLEKLGPKGYVLAAAWCPEHKAWHCHSSVSVPDCPPGVGIAFCGAMYRRFYLEMGGFEEAYRDGAGYEDRDFIRKALKAGAKFSVRDDLVVMHPKTGAQIKWSGNAFERNEALFRSRWSC